MSRNNIISKLFYQQIFAIAIRKKIGFDFHSNTFSNEPFVSVLEVDINKWYADPFIVKYMDKNYIFFENCYREKGKLQVGVINEDMVIDEIHDVLDEIIHLSYPFVFSVSEQWYMIPESHQAKEIRVYRAIEFPYVWTLEKVLYKDIDAVDTTFFTQNGSNYLITARRQNNDEAVQPTIYKLTNEEPKDWILNEINWNDYDMYHARPAGQLFDIDHHIYRPSQLCSRREYGKGVIINEVSASRLLGGEFWEKEILRIVPENISIEKFPKKLIGIHTYNSTEDYEVIDVKFEQLDIFKILRRVGRMIKNVFYLVANNSLYD